MTHREIALKKSKEIAIVVFRSIDITEISTALNKINNICNSGDIRVIGEYHKKLGVYDILEQRKESRVNDAHNLLRRLEKVGLNTTTLEERIGSDMLGCIEGLKRAEQSAMFGTPHMLVILKGENAISIMNRELYEHSKPNGSVMHIPQNEDKTRHYMDRILGLNYHDLFREETTD